MTFRGGFPLKARSYSHDIAVDPGSHRVYVAHPKKSVVSVLELVEA